MIDKITAFTTANPCPAVLSSACEPKTYSSRNPQGPDSECARPFTVETRIVALPRTLRALLVAMLVVAAFFGGMAWQRQLDKPVSRSTVRFPRPDEPDQYGEVMLMRDGTEWHREWSD